MNSLSGEEVNSLRENELLEAELALAKKPNVYFIFHLQEKKVYLKINGVTLKEWGIKSARHWGNRVGVVATSLLKRSTLFPPSRESIKPAENNDEKDFKLGALELSDMPSRYTLYLDNGIFISVRPVRKGLAAIPSFIWNAFKWSALDPLKSVWFALKKRPFTLLSFALFTKKEAQALYWSFSEGTECIVFPR